MAKLLQVTLIDNTAAWLQVDNIAYVREISPQLQGKCWVRVGEQQLEIKETASQLASRIQTA